MSQDRSKRRENTPSIATIRSIFRATQQNAALVEEASASARSMESQAGELARAVASFTLVQRPAAGNVATLHPGYKKAGHGR